MQTNIVLTLTGTDRVGLVEDVTRRLLDLGANVEVSRMARLGGEFAMLVLLSMPEEQADRLGAALEDLSAQGYAVSERRTAPADSHVKPGWSSYRIEVTGADHEGIVHEIAQGLSARGINIESGETSTSRAAVSGAQLFSMSALVSVPPSLEENEWIATLTEAGDQANVDVTVEFVE